MKGATYYQRWRQGHKDALRPHPQPFPYKESSGGKGVCPLARYARRATMLFVKRLEGWAAILNPRKRGRAG
jgi:hypothetical protein